MNEVTADVVLATRMDPEHNDARVGTIREYLVKLLLKLWYKGELFDSTRPFGNSGWPDELAFALVMAGLVEGEVHPNGYLVSYNYDEMDALIVSAIERLAN